MQFLESLKSKAHLKNVNKTMITRALFHKTLKTSLHRLTGLCKDVFMFDETEPRVIFRAEIFLGTGS